jgi:methionine sulfoxide reductase heme-binding subunit
VNSVLTSKWTKVVVLLACLTPFGQLLWRAFHNGLAGFPDNMDFGANPIEFITHATGDWTIRFLIITLAITPLRKILRQPQLIRFRPPVHYCGICGVRTDDSAGGDFDGGDDPAARR